MKRTFCILVGLFFGLSVWAGDFKNLNWGMSPVEVKKSWDKSKLSQITRKGETRLYGNIKLLDFSTYLFLDFSNNKLYTAWYSIPLEREPNTWKYVAAFNNLKKLLTEKYGKPINKNSEIITTQLGYYSRNPDRKADGLLLGDICYSADWEKDKTKINLFCYSRKKTKWSREVVIELSYTTTNKEVLKAVENKKKSAAINEL
jgi:hypothetical protein